MLQDNMYVQTTMNETDATNTSPLLLCLQQVWHILYGQPTKVYVIQLQRQPRNGWEQVKNEAIR